MVFTPPSTNNDIIPEHTSSILPGGYRLCQTRPLSPIVSRRAISDARLVRKETADGRKCGRRLSVIGRRDRRSMSARTSSEWAQSDATLHLSDGTMARGTRARTLGDLEVDIRMEATHFKIFKKLFT
ncbi:hypothetical protein CDAR_95021 [Caerostris darwini]|uniref:Uncharacterized protein n=1 Tax=Caerostris darwini TaxID=1538125 RepID=A0AAV4PIV0_9ARAC|nr:hypothetical protein CDAR_95021 [Caerostris darwini]